MRYLLIIMVPLKEDGGMCTKALWKSRRVFCYLTIVMTVLNATPFIGVSTKPSVILHECIPLVIPWVGTPRAPHLTNGRAWEQKVTEKSRRGLSPLVLSCHCKAQWWCSLGLGKTWYRGSGSGLPYIGLQVVLPTLPAPGIKDAGIQPVFCSPTHVSYAGGWLPETEVESY